MFDILLVNLGNRNICYQNKNYHELQLSRKESENHMSFYEWTQKLNENYENEKSNLDINIINPLVSQSQSFDQIVLFYSDQEKFNTRTDQDTIFEALIIKKLLIDKYKYLDEQVQLLAVNAKVIHNSGLMRFYRSEIIKLKKEYTEIHFTICDAGGTAQQKMALKVISEFLLEPDQYKVLYLENNELITDVNVNEYRSIISTEQAISLLHHGEYSAAAELLNFGSIESLNTGKMYFDKRIFAHIFYRFIQNKKMALASLNGLKIDNYPILLTYQKEIPYANNHLLEYFFGHTIWITITELFYKSIFYFNIKNYSLSILTFAHFYEKLLIEAHNIAYCNNEFGNKYRQSYEQKENLKQEFYEYYSDFLSKNNDFRIQHDSIMVQVMLLKQTEIEDLKKIGKLLSPFFTKTDDSIKDNHINSIRNNIAHNGRIVKQSEIDKELSYYPQLLQELKGILQLKSDDIFYELNCILEEALRS